MTNVPAPYYSLFETSVGDDPAYVIVNSALRTFADRAAFAWHLRLSISFREPLDNGLPTQDEFPELEAEEDRVAAPLTAGENALYLARVTCRGQRDLLFRVHDPEIADATLRRLIEEDAQAREWEYRMERDPEWALAEDVLRLVERDSGIN